MNKKLKLYHEQMLIDYKCNICQLVVCNAVQTDGCGHLFCERCLEQHLETKKYLLDWYCPTCRTELDAGTPWVRTPFIDRLLHDVPSGPCPFNCEFKGTVKELRSHICPNEPLACHFHPCTQIVPRNELMDHQQICPERKVECDLCGSCTEQKLLANHKADICPKRLISCHKCQLSMMAKEEAVHNSICPLVEIQCPYGCDLLLLRKNLETHEREALVTHVRMLHTNIFGEF